MSKSVFALIEKKNRLESEYRAAQKECWAARREFERLFLATAGSRLIDHQIDIRWSTLIDKSDTGGHRYPEGTTGVELEVGGSCKGVDFHYQADLTQEGWDNLDGFVATTVREIYAQTTAHLQHQIKELDETYLSELDVVKEQLKKLKEQ